MPSHHCLLVIFRENVVLIPLSWNRDANVSNFVVNVVNEVHSSDFGDNCDYIRMCPCFVGKFSVPVK